MITHNDYKHIIPVQIRFSDIDRLDHVNNSCYHNYVELGRVTYFKEVLKDRVHWDKTGFILARTEINHLHPVFLNDEIYCCTKLLKFGTKSMTLKNAIVKKTAEGIVECASIIGILVAMDYVKNESMVVPQEWRELLEGYEK